MITKEWVGGGCDMAWGQTERRKTLEIPCNGCKEALSFSQYYDLLILVPSSRIWVIGHSDCPYMFKLNKCGHYLYVLGKILFISLLLFVFPEQWYSTEVSCGENKNKNRNKNKKTQLQSFFFWSLNVQITAYLSILSASWINYLKYLTKRYLSHSKTYAGSMRGGGKNLS